MIDYEIYNGSKLSKILQLCSLLSSRTNFLQSCMLNPNLFLFAEKICGNLTDFDNDTVAYTVAVSNPASYLDTANYTCKNGYHISPGVYSDIVTCTQHGNWSSGPPLCNSESIFINIYKFIKYYGQHATLVNISNKKV